MKKLMSPLALLLLAPALSAQMHVVQSTSAYVHGSPVVLSFPAAPATHSVLVAACGYYAGTPTKCAPPDASWAERTRTTSPDPGLVIYTHTVAAGEANSYSFGNDNGATIAAFEVAGAAFYAPANRAASAANTTAGITSVSTPSVTPTVAGTLALAFFAADDANATVTTSGWTGLASPNPIHAVGAALGMLTSDTTTPIQASFAITGADTHGVVTAILLLAPYDPTPIAPVAAVTGQYSGIAGRAVQFDGTPSTDPKLEALAYAWTFGDGGTSTSATPAHAYAAAGTFTAHLTVTNADNLAASIAFPVIIQTGCSGAVLGNGGSLGGFVISPNDQWHQDISASPVDPLSNTILVTNHSDLAGYYLHPDIAQDGTAGIPYRVVDSSTMPLFPVSIRPQGFGGDSDNILIPIPIDAPIESAPADCTSTADNHTLLFDRASCSIVEMYHAERCPAGGNPNWQADSLTLWDATISQKRPYGLTSADVAGFSVMEGEIRYEEIAAGVINHSIRFTVGNLKKPPTTGNARYSLGFYTGGASHSSGQYGDGVDLMPGVKIRLKASFDISGYPLQARIILTAMKKYGMTVADLGTSLFFQAAPDPRWDDTQLNTLKTINASNFEVVDPPGSGPLATDYAPGSASFYPQGNVYDDNNHPSGTLPTATLTASAVSIAAGQSVTLTPAVSAGASYSFIDQLGLVRGPVTVTPTATTTYTLTSRNSFGSAISATTVTVGQPSPPAVIVSVAPATASLAQGATQQLAATVTNSSSTAVTWTLSPAVGSISAGLYTAPSTVASSATVTVTATSAADTTKTATATITLTPPAPVVAIALAPAIASLAASQTQQFTVTGSGNTAVTWTISGGTATNVGTNLYDATAEVENYLLAADGTLVLDTAAGNQAFTSGPMDTHGLTAIFVNFNVASIDHYAADGSFIAPQDAVSRSYDASGVTNRIPIPPNTAYTRVCSLGATTAAAYRMASSSNARLLTYVPYTPLATGTISSGGLYAAPSTVGTAQSVVVTATSTADSTKTAMATVVLLPTVPPVVAPPPPVVLPTPSGLVTVSATRLTSGGIPIANATITFTPVVSGLRGSSGFRIGGTLGGQSSADPITASVTNGAFPPVTLANARLTTPKIAYQAVVRDLSTGASLLGPNYRNIQPSDDLAQAYWCATDPTTAVTTVSVRLWPCVQGIVLC